MRLTASRPAVVVVATLMAACPSRAGAEARSGTISLTVENDLFYGRDRHYTNGIRAAYVTNPDAVPEWLRTAATTLPFFPDHGEMRASFAVGQNMFTPEDIRQRQPAPGDRPYAGWLYVSAGLVADTGARLDSVELSLGVVGPSSLAAETQDLVHRIIGAPRPRGWHTQLDDEPAVLLTWQRSWRQWLAADVSGFTFDVTPHAGAALGNVYTYANAGAMVRIGQDLPHDYGPPRIQPSLPGSGYFVPRAGLGWYLFAGIDARLRLRDIFLDGNTFGGRGGIDRHFAVADLQAGLAVTFGDVRIAYTHVMRTPDYGDQNGLDHFGAVSLSLRF